MGVAPVLAVSAITRAECDYWTGAWAPAYADATEALQWAEEFGQIGVAAYSRTVLARLGQRAVYSWKVQVPQTPSLDRCTLVSSAAQAE